MVLGQVMYRQCPPGGTALDRELAPELAALYSVRACSRASSYDRLYVALTCRSIGWPSAAHSLKSLRG